MKKTFSFKKRFGFPLRKKIKYILDDFISQGFWAQILLLAGASIVLTLLFGVVTMKLGGENYTESYWTSLMHMIDQGTITGDETGTDSYFMFMLFVTVIGMAFTGTIIALITSGLQNKLNELREGHSGIIEKDHVVILGFDDNVLTICREIVEGGHMNGERICLVIADDLPKEEMEHAWKAFRNGPQHSFEAPGEKKKRERKIRVIFRSGDPVSENTLSICAVQNARSVVINREKDPETIRILLGLASCLKKNNSYLNDSRMPSIIALIHEQDNLSAARAAAGISSGEGAGAKQQDRIQLIHDGAILEQLFSQACIQQGLPFVMDGLFNYRGSSIRIESDREFRNGDEEHPFTGKNLAEISAMVTDSIPLGFIGKRTEDGIRVRLNPSETVRYQQGDRLIYLSEKDGLHLGEQEAIEPEGVPAGCITREKREIRNFLLIGWSNVVPGILSNVHERSTEGSTVTILAKDPKRPEGMENCAFTVRILPCDEPYRWSSVKSILDANRFLFDRADNRSLTNIILLSEDETDAAAADDNVMLLLLNLRQYLKEKGCTDINVISEMRLPQNQMLLQENSSSDYVVATEISNRIIAQITDDLRKHDIIKELLNQEHTLIKLHPLSDYVDLSHPFNFEGVFRAAVAMEKETGESEIPLGWLRIGQSGEGMCRVESDRPKLVLNPRKTDLEKVYPGGNYDNYRLIVLTE